ncbi:MAG: hypothetical protein J2P25_18485 [Nocardiopsaceae bacterium]|nr:hypothetical protein [Nocardiopsaceae bacterium]
MSGQLRSEGAIYRDERCGIGRPLVVGTVASWVVMIGSFVAMGLMNLAGLGLIGAIACVYTIVLSACVLCAAPLGICLYGDKIQIGGMRTRQRLQEQGKWPPREPPPLGSQNKAVFTCPLDGVRGLYLITSHREIRRVRKAHRRFTNRTETMSPLGAFCQATYFAKAILVIINDPRLTESEPAEFRTMRGRYGTTWRGVASPTWVVPTRHPGALRAALSQVPTLPVQDSLPPGTPLQFTTGR